ncbi:hypothetical protein [Streptomyces sp. NPDC088789]|uniref:hypothetical protein n=1 Tax=Streptomyces sp. NPDC088789 TaxID=3365899 RepID=UPI00380D5CA1
MTDQKCAAPGQSCGTASGWRKGGRCARCRRAHNEETKHYRGLGADGRQTVLTALRSGMSPEEAAAQADVTRGTLSRMAERDGELFTALEGQTPAQQQAARRGDFLAALTRSQGRPLDAARMAGIPPEEVTEWRTDPMYARLEDTMLQWLRQASRQSYARMSDEDLDRAAELLERGATIRAAAAEIGCSGQALRNAGERHERLRAALPVKKSKLAGGGSRGHLTPQKEARLRQMCGDPRYTLKGMALQLEITDKTLRNWIDRLDLPVDQRQVDPRGRKRAEPTDHPH